MAEEKTQRRFAVLGDNVFKITNKLVNNQKLCRLLKYQNRDPFSEELEDVKGTDLLHNQIRIIPLILDDNTEKMSYVVARFGSYTVTPGNLDYKTAMFRFDIACPYDEWILNYNSLRPYLIMQEIDTMFNEKALSGIGRLKFVRAEALNLSPQLGGFSMIYSVNEFN